MLNDAAKLNENLPSTSDAKISAVPSILAETEPRRSERFFLNLTPPIYFQQREYRRREPVVHSLPDGIPKVNEDLPTTSTTLTSERRQKSISSRDKKPTERKTTAKPKVAVPIAVHPSSVEIAKVNEDLPTTSATITLERRHSKSISYEDKKPTGAQPKTAAKSEVAVHPSSVKISKVNQNLLTTTTAMFSQRFFSNGHKKPTKPALSTTVYSTPVPKKVTHQTSSVHPNPNKIRKLNENLSSTSNVEISKRLIIEATQSAVPSILAVIPNHTPSNPMGTECKIEIPTELKTLLVNDTNIVKHQGKHYKIPATQSVAKIIKLYVALNQTERIDEKHFHFTFEQIFKYILHYFDMLLAVELLSEPERMRHLDVINNFPGEMASTLYPPIYLLRLIVKLNYLLRYSCKDNDTWQYMVHHINKFAKYLAENKSIFNDMNILT